MKKAKYINIDHVITEDLKRALREAADQILKNAREYYGGESKSWNHDEANRILIAPNAQINTSIFEEAEVVPHETM
jgi:hypothetical protein